MPNSILFISKGGQSSSTRYRALQYFPYFIAAGWQPKHITISGGLIPVLRVLIAARKADIVVLLRKTFPYPIFWMLRRLSKKLIFDFDDAIFCNSDGSYSKTRMRRFKTTVSNCDYILAGNEYLATEAGKHNPAVAVIPTSVDAEKYALRRQKRTGVLELVWIGSSSTRKYLEEVIPFLEDAARAVPSLQLNVIADFELTSNTFTIKNIPWSEQSEATELCIADIGIAPMPENNWTKGKCALKVLQYMAAGLPVLSSQSGVNAYVVENGVSGYLVSENSQWAKLIVQMNKDKAAMEQMGKCGRNRVQSEFSIDVVFRKLMAIVTQ